jgi:hypothetical protein
MGPSQAKQERGEDKTEALHERLGQVRLKAKEPSAEMHE